MKPNSLKKQHIYQLALWVGIILLSGLIASFVFFRIDLTQEKRYTLSHSSKEILGSLPGQVFVKVYLEGEIPSGFKKLSRAVREMLDEFRVYAGNNIQYQFSDPYQNSDAKAVKAILNDLYNRGLQPVNVKIRDNKGGYSEKMVVPGIIISYNGIEIPLGILSNNPALSGDENLNNSLQDLEYQLIKTIKSITFTKLEKIAFLEGHGELDQYQTGDITRELANYFQVDRGAINGNIHALNPYKCVIIAKPQMPFSEEDKFVIDQYIMHGGKVLWFIDAVHINHDSIAGGRALSTVAQLNIDDMLFVYGFRINPVLVQDVQCALLPVNTSIAGAQPKFVPAPWQYTPLLSGSPYHPVSRNLNMVKAEFCGFIDTLNAKPGSTKSILLHTSQYSRIKEVPAFISLQEMKQQLPREAYNRPNMPVAVVATGNFRSAFTNRPLTHLKLNEKPQFLETSVQNSMLVVADGDIIRNDIKHTPEGILISPLGTDKYTSQVYGNKEFVLNAIDYLTDDKSLMQLRTREIKLRLLNKNELRDNKPFWQVLNVGLPVFIVVLAGFIYLFIRKKKFS